MHNGAYEIYIKLTNFRINLVHVLGLCTTNKRAGDVARMEEMKKCEYIQNSAEKLQEKRQLGKPRSRWLDVMII
jgi:hypothetical protein